MKKFILALLLFCPFLIGASERYYQNKYCEGQREFVLKDRTRVDCLTDEYAIEYEFAHKWYEAIGQSLHYARLTGKKAGIALIVRNDRDMEFYNNLMAVIKYFQLPITTWIVK